MITSRTKPAKKLDALLVKTPVGELTVFALGDAIVALDWGQGGDATRTTKSPVLNRAAQALSAYFKTGILDTKALRLAPQGTPFQQRAWSALQKIKSGHTKTYGEIAEALHSAPRAVGGACAANPIPILIPCHRVISADGKLSFYSGGDGPKTKAFLLRLEGALT